MSAEILKMHQFNHPNVMRLIGVCWTPSDHDTRSSDPCIVMPFMANGSLLDYLRKEADSLFVETEQDPKVSEIIANH